MRYKILTFVLLLGTVGLLAQEKKQTAPPDVTSPHPATISPEDKARPNPMKFTEVSVARGKKIFATQCTLCHGEKGDGKGELGADMKLTVPDFTKAETLKDRTDGEIFAIIGTGSQGMPAQEHRLSDIQKWNLVNYIRTLSGKVPEKSTGNEPDENTITVPQ
jgi:mono/diheme cytochrome c family protein